MSTFIETVSLISKYLEPTSIRVDRRQSGVKKIRVIDINSRVRLDLFWADIFEYLFEEKLDFPELNEMLTKEFSFYSILSEISRKQLYSFAKHSGLKIWGTEIRYYADRIIQGFDKQSEKYGEFIVQINTDFDDYYEVIDSLTYNFTIEDVSIVISQPSDVFKLIFFGIAASPNFGTSWEDIITIKFINLKKSKRESILQQAIFIMRVLNGHFLIFGIRNQDKEQPSFKNCNFNKQQSKKFPAAHFYEPITFYNLGQDSPPEICFFHYYRVLEFFFSRVKNDLLSENMKNNDSSDEPKKIRDVQILIHMLNTPAVKETVIYIADEDFFLDILERKMKSGNQQLGNIVQEFARELYNYRNRVVHSADKDRKVPSILDETTVHDYVAMEWWNEAIKEVALSVIKQFCYDNIDIDNM